MSLEKKRLEEADMNGVAGGAQVVEINANDRYIPRCFSCRSTNLTIERKANSKIVTCNDCGAVDFQNA